MPLELTSRRLFLRKLLALAIGTVLFIPLIQFRLHQVAIAYIGGLLILHVVFLYLYLLKTPWRLFWQHKTGFFSRLGAVGFFIYLLSLVRFDGGIIAIIRNCLLALGIHIAILLALMVQRKQPAESTRSDAV